MFFEGAVQAGFEDMAGMAEGVEVVEFVAAAVHESYGVVEFEVLGGAAGDAFPTIAVEGINFAHPGELPGGVRDVGGFGDGGVVSVEVVGDGGETGGVVYVGCSGGNGKQGGEGDEYEEEGEACKPPEAVACSKHILRAGCGKGASAATFFVSGMEPCHLWRGVSRDCCCFFTTEEGVIDDGEARSGSYKSQVILEVRADCGHSPRDAVQLAGVFDFLCGGVRGVPAAAAQGVEHIAVGGELFFLRLVGLAVFVADLCFDRG